MTEIRPLKKRAPAPSTYLDTARRLRDAAAKAGVKDWQLVIGETKRGGSINLYVQEPDDLGPLLLLPQTLDWSASIKGELVEVRFFKAEGAHEPGPDPATDWMTLNELLEQCERWLNEED